MFRWRVSAAVCRISGDAAAGEVALNIQLRVPGLDVRLPDSFGSVAGEAAEFVRCEPDRAHVEPAQHARTIENAGEDLDSILGQTDRSADVAPPFPVRFHIID